MRALLVVMMLTVLIASALAAPASAQEGDYDCSVFESQAAAQRFFFNNGGSPTNNVEGLDADGDGWVCEGNPPPFFSGFSPTQANEDNPTTDDDDRPARELPKSGSGGYLAPDRFMLSPMLLLIGAMALGVTLLAGGLHARRSLR